MSSAIGFCKDIITFKQTRTVLLLGYASQAIKILRMNLFTNGGLTETFN
jgi:hypothetical protein